MLIQPVRKIHNVNSSKVIGLFYSHKMGKQLPFESTLEKDWLLWLDYRRDIKTIAVQPKTFTYTEFGASRRYTPDVHVTFRDGRYPVYFEVKPSGTELLQRFSEQFELHRRAIERHDAELQLVTCSRIRIEPHLSNLKRLKTYASVPSLVPSEREAVQTILSQHGPLPLSALLHFCRKQDLPITPEDIFREAFLGQLFIDLSQPVTPNPLIYQKEICHVT